MAFDPVLNLSDLDGRNGFVINGIDAYDFSSGSVSSAGDVNGDRIDDLIIGATNADPNDQSVAGETYIVFGSSNGFASSLELSSLNGSNGFVINGIDSGDFSGRSVSSAGDVNGDGIDDIIIGADLAYPNGRFSGESYVVFGSSDGFTSSLELSSINGSNGFRLNGIDSIDRSGSSVSSAGDVNGDGIDDIIIGAYRADPNGQYDAGESYVVFGSSNGFASSLELSSLNGSNGFRLNGIDSIDNSGISVSSAGDVNGDGIDDLIIGADGASPNGQSGAGESYVVFGSSNGFASSLELSSINGSNGFRLNGIDSRDNSGISVSSAGDVNGDGIDDLIIGARFADPNSQSSAGESYVVFGRSGGFASSLDLSALDGSNGFVINGIDSNDRSGSSVSSAGDVNGDGIDDLIIGARFADPNSQSDAGESYVVFGRSGGFASSLDLSALDGSNGFVINGIDSNDRSAGSVSSAGDVNGDGFDDIIIGAYGADPNGNESAGESYVVFGRPTSSNNSPVAVDDTFTTEEDVAATFDVLSNDSDPDDDTLSINSVTQPVNGGTVTPSEDSQTLVYTPSTGFTGTDTFTYSVSDGNGGTDTATVNVNVVESEEPIFTITVDTPVDEDDNDLSIGDVSLRDALKAIPDGGTINFSNSLINETITLDATFGELVVDKSVTINGLGDDQLTIDAAGNSRVFKVDDGNNTPDKIVTIDGLTITGGVASGSFRNNRGGGIDNRENLTVSNSTITGNSSNGRGAGISNYYSTANITNNTITGNSSNSSGGGISNLFSTADITNSTIIGNSSNNSGGGISNLFSTADMTNNIVTGNSARSYGGGILNSKTISTITNNIITVNSAIEGGGVSNIESSITDISNSTISGNSAGGGGGLYNFGSTANISNSTISGNSASVGGGIYNYLERTQLNISNSTISGNSSGYRGGGILISRETTATINNSTIIGNSAAVGAGIFNQGDIVNIASTIVAGNANDNDIDGSSLFTSNGNNLIGNGDGASGFTDGVNGDIVGTSDSPIDPVLGPLQNNGGLTETHAILPDSPAINAGSNPLGLTTDQRGEARVQQGVIDIGAFESALLPNQPPNPNLEATNGDDSLVGTEGNDTIAGLLGDDEILGLAGDDVLRGDQNKRSPGSPQQGNDTIFGGAGDDRIGGKGGDDELYGDEGDDQIWGDDGDDILRGGLGDDILTGDDFSGGQGSDTFILAPGEGTDTIVDFEVGIDRIGLAEGLTFTDLTLTSGMNEVTVNFGEETLATVLGVNTLTEADFEFV